MYISKLRILGNVHKLQKNRKREKVRLQKTHFSRFSEEFI